MGVSVDSTGASLFRRGGSQWLGGLIGYWRYMLTDRNRRCISAHPEVPVVMTPWEEDEGKAFLSGMDG